MHAQKSLEQLSISPYSEKEYNHHDISVQNLAEVDK